MQNLDYYAILNSSTYFLPLFFFNYKVGKKQEYTYIHMHYPLKTNGYNGMTSLQT
jgi:hypothetical protein